MTSKLQQRKQEECMNISVNVYGNLIISYQRQKMNQENFIFFK